MSRSTPFYYSLFKIPIWFKIPSFIFLLPFIIIPLSCAQDPLFPLEWDEWDPVDNIFQGATNLGSSTETELHHGPHYLCQPSSYSSGMTHKYRYIFI